MNLSDLNDRQQEAVMHVEGPLLVLAGAGSGKTRVITYRIAHLVRLGVPPEKILALSFTNKAAREVEERATALVGRQRADGLTVSTFHSLGLQVLREDLHRLGFDRSFTLHTEGDQRALLREIVREAALPLDISELQAVIGSWKNEGLEPEAVPVRPGDALAKRLRDAYASYQGLLRAQNAVDFDDLLCLPLRIFRESRDCLHHWQGRYRFLLVDEYQDTNRVQFELLKALAGERRNLCVVGDDDQAIYGWRGARVEQILRFEEHFPGAKVVLLEENYRSSRTILDAAHAVASRIGERRAKRLWTARGRGEPLGWIEAEDPAGEAEEVVGAILAERFRARRRWSDFAVLYRTNAQGRSFEAALRHHEVPYRVVGGSRFFDRKEVRDVLSYLKAIHNPADQASLLRIANVPKRGLGPQALLRLRGEAAERGLSLRSALAQGLNLSPQARAGAKSLLTLLEAFGKRFRAEGLTSAGLLELIRESGLRAEIEAAYESRQAVERRMALLEELARWVDESRHGGRLELGPFIEKLSLDPPSEKDAGDEEAVTLMTLHSAKGLEFPVVFLTGMEEGLLPHARETGDSETGDADEERRLCYVGMTRARDKLFVCHAHTRRRRGGPLAALPSRFLAEIPAELTERGGAAAERSPEEEKSMARNFFEGIKGMLS